MKIFIVEDNIFYANVLKIRLEKYTDQEIQIFETGLQCINNLHHQPDIIFLDYFLPQMKGIDLIKHIKSTYPTIQVIMLSAQERIEIAVEALKYGALDYIVKNQDDDNHRISKLMEDISEVLRTNQKRSTAGVLRRFLNH